MVDPVDGKIIYPYSDRIWARVVDNEVQLLYIKEHTCTFLDTIERLHETTGLKLTEVHVHSVLFPELCFENYKGEGYAMVFYDDRCWNIQTSCLYMNSKMMREAVIPFLEFLDGHAVDVNWNMVKEYLGLKEEN